MKDISIGNSWKTLDYRQCKSNQAYCHTCSAKLKEGDLMLSVPSSRMNKAIVCNDCFTELITELKAEGIL